MASGDRTVLEKLNRHRKGFDAAMGLRFLQASAEEVVAQLEVSDQHRQPQGLVHGGVFAGVIESICSVGAGLSGAGQEQSAVGLENATSFLRAVRAGTLRAVARPLARGRRSQVWQAEITDDRGRLVATGRVRLLMLERDAMVEGRPVGLLDAE